MAGQKRIKLCSSETPANAAKSQELRHSDTNAPQTWEIKCSVMFALSLIEEKKVADHSTTNCGLVYLFTTPLLCLSLSLFHMHTAAHWPENSRIPVWALSLAHFIAPSFPLVSLKAPTFWLRASLCHLSSQQFVSIFSFSRHVCAVFCSGRTLKWKKVA